MSLKQSAVSGVKWTTLSMVVVTVLQIVQLTVLARLLGPADFGLMAMAMIVIGFAQAYADMGVSAALVHRQDISTEQLSSLYWLNVFAGVIVFVVMCATTPLAACFFHEPRLLGLLPLVSLSVLISSASLQFHWLLEKQLRFNLLAKVEMCACTAGATVAISSALLGQGVWSLVWGLLTNVGAKTTLLLCVGLTHWPPQLHFRRRDLNGFLGFGLYQMGERSINYLNSRIDQLLIGSLLGPQELGYYNFAFTLVIQPSAQINPILTRVAFPLFAKMQNDPRGLQQGYIKMTSLLCTLNAPILFGLGAVAPLLVPLCFGPKWMPAVLLVQVLSLYALVRSTGNPVGSLLLAKGRADTGFRWNLGLLFVITPVVYAGARAGGAMGIALALVCLQVILSVLNYRILLVQHIGHCARPYSAAILKPFALALIMALCVGLLPCFPDVPALALGMKLVVGIAVYLGLTFFFARDLMVEMYGMIFRRGAP